MTDDESSAEPKPASSPEPDVASEAAYDAAPGATGHSDLEALAARARLLVIESVARAKAGHIGGPLSAMDLLIALYFRVLRIDPARPDWPERDRFGLTAERDADGVRRAVTSITRATT